MMKRRLSIGYFGASTERPQRWGSGLFCDTIKAVVSRGGRPDLALSALDQVTAPTLLIVGGMDMPVIEMNKTAYDELHCIKR
jgi:hypothetical protein